MATRCLGEREGLTFWLARPDDFEDVMSISDDIYVGNDYLPHRYHLWMEEPGRVVVLARRDAKLMALESFLVVDEGSTVVVEGLRVCPTQRGTGLAGVIQRFVDGYICHLHPSVKAKRLTRNDDPGPNKLAKFSVLARRAVLSFVGEAASFESFVSHLKSKLAASGPPVPAVVPLETTEQLRTVLLDPGLPSRARLPGGAIIQDWQPLRLMEGNLALLGRRELDWFADKREAPAFLALSTRPYPVPFQGGALRASVDLFGTDPGLAKAALVSALESAGRQGWMAGTVLVHMYMEETLREELRGFCGGHAGVREWRSSWLQLLVEGQMSGQRDKE